MQELDLAAIFRALGDPNRLEIVRMLADGEKCACRLLERFRITQPTLSHHMKVLCESGLVMVRKEGKWSHYSLRAETFCALRLAVASLADTVSESGCER